MASGKPNALSDILKKVVSGLRKKKITEEALVDAWVTAAGESAAAHTKPVGFRKHRLTVNVDSSSWLYELTLKKEEILKALELKLEGAKVKDLRLRIGDIKNNIKE